MAVFPPPSLQRFADEAFIQHSREAFEQARRLELEAALGKYNVPELSQPKPSTPQPKRKVVLLCS